METLAQKAKRILDPIPEDKWSIKEYGSYREDECKCFLGHWNYYHSRMPDYSQAERPLVDLVNKFFKDPYEHAENAFMVNDGIHELYQQSTPKQRVMALLDDMIKAGY